MDTLALQAVLSNVTDQSAAKAVLRSVRDIVYSGYGEKWWESPYRIDDFELSARGLRLVVSDRTLKQQFRHLKKFSVVAFQKPRLAA